MEPIKEKEEYSEEGSDYEEEYDEEEEGSDYDELDEAELEELNKLVSSHSVPAPTDPFVARDTPWGRLSLLQTIQQKTSSDADGEDKKEGSNEEEDSLVSGLKTMAISNAKNTASYLVLDTNAIIHSEQRFETLAMELWTIPEVLDEVKDKKTLDYLQSLPYEIQTREPEPSSIRDVIEFAKLTGDYTSLSNVDLKVMALTHTLHKLYDNKDTIKSTITLPNQPTVITNNDNNNNDNNNKNNNNNNTTTTTASTESNNNYNNVNNNNSQQQQTKKKKRNRNKNKNKEPKVDTCCGGHDHHHDKKKDEKKEEVAKVDTCCSGHDHKEEKPTTSTPSTTSETTTTESTTTESTTPKSKSKKNSKKNSLKVNLDELEEDDTPIVDGKELLARIKAQKLLEEEERRKNYVPKEDPDDGEWITPDNLSVVKKRTGRMGTAKESVQKHVKVAIMTSDFPMQNVLLQMGLNVIATNGLMIERVNQFIMKCFACYHTTSDMSAIWCQHCGNKTMVKAMTWVDRHGNVRVGQGSGKQFNTRGKRYSIPKLKGGQKHTDLVHSEEQYVHRLKATGLYYRKRAYERKLKEVMSSDDPTSLEGLESILAKAPVDNVTIGYGNINPNVPRRKIGKKNKSIRNNV